MAYAISPELHAKARLSWSQREGPEGVPGGQWKVRLRLLRLSRPFRHVDSQGHGQLGLALPFMTISLFSWSWVGRKTGGWEEGGNISAYLLKIYSVKMIFFLSKI